MSPQDIVIGTRLELEMLDDNGERIGNVYVSQLLEHQEDGTIVISAPISGSRVIYVPDGITIRLTFIDPIQGLLGFTAVVGYKEYRGKVAVIIVKPGTEILKIQRRMHYRLEIVLDAAIRPVNAVGTAKAEEKTDPVKVCTKNISGSGACIISETDIPKNTMLEMELDLTDGTQIKTRGVVVRSQEVEARKGRNYEVGVYFTDISKKDQDRLIRYIFEQQRILLKKDREKEQ